jgi:dTMP kinase
VNGYFITFEGSEGCGKTTQIEALAKALEAQGKTVLITREPGGTLIGEKIRNLLQDPSHKNDISDMTELLLFSARVLNLSLVVFSLLYHEVKSLFVIAFMTLLSFTKG